MKNIITDKIISDHVTWNHNLFRGKITLPSHKKKIVLNSTDLASCLWFKKHFAWHDGNSKFSSNFLAQRNLCKLISFLQTAMVKIARFSDSTLPRKQQLPLLLNKSHCVVTWELLEGQPFAGQFAWRHRYFWMCYTCARNLTNARQAMLKIGALASYTDRVLGSS